MMPHKRKIQVAVISDVHLGTYGCHADELLNYLKSIDPEVLILNGDIIDIWQFRKNYWPEAHRKVIKCILDFVTSDIPVYYLTGNHDEMLRKFSGLQLANFHLKDKVVLNLDGKKAWFFHGDIFDVTMQYSKWLAKLGAIGYDFLITLNQFVNFWSNVFGKGRFSFSKKIKDSVKSAIKYIHDFEKTATDLAIENGYHYVVCGHIHHPNINTYSNSDGSVLYLNSGDWIENLTALEYSQGQWRIYHYNEDDYINATLSKEHNKTVFTNNNPEKYVPEQMMYILKNLR
jgi:UDP-2,3-diacylglucosamine pyrophosphatase LpxH